MFVVDAPSEIDSTPKDFIVAGATTDAIVMPVWHPQYLSSAN